jgi:DNA-binding NtrC family response regulator
MADILLVDDEKNVRRAIALQLSRIKAYNVEEVDSGTKAITLLKEKYFDLVITDLKMSPVNGIEVLKQSKKMHPVTEVIVITGEGTVKTGVEAMKLGAYHFIEKPLNPEEFIILVEKALEKAQALKEVKYLREELKNKYKFENIIGNSEPMNKILKLVSQVAHTDSTVLVTGESGTGKELIAKAIHNNSNRNDKPILVVNISALPENLIDSELFGHVKGAFTGAIKDKKGIFEEADMGTIFLDEIGDAPPQTQIRLLRAIEHGEIKRVGDNKTIHVDVRIVTATNKNLKELIKEGKFREDLYFRLNVIPIDIPPLRDKKEDIPILVNHFMQKYARENNSEIKTISPSALSLFLDYNWEGNVRELENIIERTMVLCNKDNIETDDLALSFPQGVPRITSAVEDKTDMTLEEMEKWLILSTLERYDGNQKLTAQKLGISTTTLWRKLKQYGILTTDEKKDN